MLRLNNNYEAAMPHILIVDDDRELQSLLAERLELEGYQISQAFDGKSALQQAQGAKQADLILLDVMMPQLNGFEVLKQVRQTSQVPILMLTAKGEEMDRVLGLELGADDYLAKPFSDRELLARIKAILRRSQQGLNTQQEKQSISAGDISINPTTQQVLCQNINIDLTGTEYLLLSYLLQHVAQLLSKEQLSKQVLGKNLQAFDRSIDVHLSNLRKKLPARQDGLERIKTLRGRGYIWLGDNE